jgi:hypothetical protein
MPRIYLSIRSEESTTLRDILADTPLIPENCQWVTFLRNHDELTLEMVRHAPALSPASLSHTHAVMSLIPFLRSLRHQVTPAERKWMWEQYAPDPRMKINLGIRRRLAPLVHCSVLCVSATHRHKQSELTFGVLLQMNNDRRQIELAYSLLFTLPGSPILYYGDEIGMGDNIWLPDRNGVRSSHL